MGSCSGLPALYNSHFYKDKDRSLELCGVLSLGVMVSRLEFSVGSLG